MPTVRAPLRKPADAFWRPPPAEAAPGAPLPEELQRFSLGQAAQPRIGQASAFYSARQAEPVAIPEELQRFSLGQARQPRFGEAAAFYQARQAEAPALPEELQRFLTTPERVPTAEPLSSVRALHELLTEAAELHRFVWVVPPQRRPVPRSTIQPAQQPYEAVELSRFLLGAARQPEPFRLSAIALARQAEALEMPQELRRFLLGVARMLEPAKLSIIIAARQPEPADLPEELRRFLPASPWVKIRQVTQSWWVAVVPEAAVVPGVVEPTLIIDWAKVFGYASLTGAGRPRKVGTKR